MQLSRPRKWLLIGLLLCGSLACAGIFGIRYWSSSQTHGRAAVPNTLVPIDFSTPDALIRSQALSSLPRDLLRVPLLKKTLTEEFAFYYEEQESRLSLAGTLRRLAYEHQLNIGDKLIQLVLDSPAELALWRGPNGKLEYWMLTLEQNLVAKAITTLATLTLDDSQLSKMGTLKVSGNTEPLYLLNYGYQHQLVMASHGNRLVLLSDPGMLLGFEHPKQDAPPQHDEDNTDKETNPDSGKAAAEEEPHLLSSQLAWLEKRLQPEQEQQALSQQWQLPEQQQGHSLLVSTNYLSFGYQRFFPAIDALRFDFDGKQWASHALLDNSALKQQTWNSETLWSAIPTAPAACASLPIDWASVTELTEKLMPSSPEWSKAMGAMNGPMATCWYEKSRLAAPLFVARFDDEKQAQQYRQILGKLFEQHIGAREFIRGSRFPVEQQDTQGAHYWKRVVSARYGSQLAADEPFKDELSSARFFPVALATSGPWLFFSPDGKLVEQAVAVQQKRYPSQGDGLGAADRTIAILTPATLASLIEREMYAALPGQDEPLFRDAAKIYLAPRLKALAEYPPLFIALQHVPGGGVLPLGNGKEWQPLDIQFAK
jgi:uncharacterized protein YfaA (DUF2138 family)